MVKSSPTRVSGFIPGPGRSSGGRNGELLPYSLLGTEDLAVTVMILEVDTMSS